MAEEVLTGAETAPEDGENDPYRRRRRGEVAALAAIAALLMWAIWWILTYTVIVPSVVGMDKADATIELTRKRLLVGTITEVATKRYVEGEVAIQAPVPGQRVLKHSRIDITLAKGVSSVSGDGTPGTSRTSKRYPLPKKGGAEETPQQPGQPAPRTSPPAAVGRPIPPVQALSEAEARATLDDAGYRVSVKYGPSTAGPGEGMVYFQKPEPGALGDSGTLVEIWVSTGGPTDGYPYPRPEE